MFLDLEFNEFNMTNINTIVLYPFFLKLTASIIAANMKQSHRRFNFGVHI